MPSQPELYERFRALHERPGGFIMPNPWDGASALLMKDAGFEALGTSSAAIALSLGRLDGRHAVKRDEHLANARLLFRVTGLPVNGDLEDGFGPEPSDVAETVRRRSPRVWPASASRTPRPIPSGRSTTSTRPWRG